MSGFGSKIREKLQHFSGDSSVTTDAMGENREKWSCKDCNQTWQEADKNKPDLVECCACNKWSCTKCTKLRKNEINALARDDILWACNACTDFVKLVLTGGKNDMTRVNETLTEQLKAFESRIEQKIEDALNIHVPKAVEKCVKEVTEGVPKAVEECMQKVTEGVDSSMASCLEKVEGNVSNQVEKCMTQVQEGVSASVDDKISDMWTEVVGRKQKKNNPDKNPGIITTAMKRVMLEQKTEDMNRDERLKNFIVHRLPESNRDTADERREDDENKISEFLTVLGVPDKPKKMYRLGKFTETNKTSPRPLKVVMETCEAQSAVMNNLKELAKADQHLKNLSISYDMTNDERAMVKEKVEEAKEKTKQSKNWIYKIRGPYWNLKEIKIQKEPEEE